MAANGRIPTSNLSALPKSWSNRGRDEYLRRDAFESLSRALNRAVADSGENFQIWDAYRSLSEQVAMLQKNYYAVGGGRRAGDRSYRGVTYRRRSGRPATASPGYSNHGTGLAIDIHSTGIQNWFKKNGRTYGWTWDEGRRLGESWHFVYNPALDQMKHEGLLDHSWVQKIVGAEVDGKIGTGTVKKIKEWQKANGLTADGKVGAGTKKKMRGEIEVITEEIAAVADEAVFRGVAGEYFSRSEWTSNPKEAVVLADNPERIQTEIYIHYPGQGSDIGDAPKSSTKNRINGYYRSHVSGEYSDIAYNLAVDQGGNIWELRGIDRQSGANGGTTTNRRGQAILVLVGNDEIPTDNCIAGIRKAVSMIRDMHSEAKDILGHQESFEASTECPGVHLMALVDAGALDPDNDPASAGATSAPKNTSGVVDVDGRWGRETSEEIQTRLGVRADGRMGPDSWRAMQALFGTPADGIVSKQSHRHDALGNGISPNGWDYTGPNSSGSTLIKKLQTAVGATADGVLGGGTIKLTQKKLNSDPRFLKGKGFTDVDGRFGTDTVKAAQRFLNSEGANLKVDGKAGHNFWKAWQKFLGTHVDGKVSNQSHRAEDLGNGITQGWEYTGPNSSGSTMVRALQTWAGATPDGVWGEGTTAAIQRKLISLGYEVS